LHRRIILSSLSCAIAFAQNVSNPPSFEVSDLKMNRSGEARMSIDIQPGGRFVAHNVPLKVLIALSNQVRPDVVKGPAWLDSDRYDIVAKASPTATAAQVGLMLKGLLAERFKLTTHVDQKDMPAYALGVSRSGAKFTASDSATVSEQRCVPADGTPGQRHFACRHMTMPVFAATLQEIASRDIDVPVVDQTRLSGAFDFKLDWMPAPRAADTAATDLPAGPTLFDAVESQLGLKLERKMLPLPIIVIDGIERAPVEN